MTNKKKYQKIFIESLSIDTKAFNENLKYNEIPEWPIDWSYDLVSGLEDGSFKSVWKQMILLTLARLKKGLIF